MQWGRASAVRYTICDPMDMVDRKDPGKMDVRVAFLEANSDLLERCTTITSKERKHYVRELVTKARAYFRYSDKTIAQDILRPLLRAYQRHQAVKTGTAVLQPLFRREGHMPDGTTEA